MCFRRQYGLHPDTRMADVVSNLSQDGVLVITLPKEKRIQEVKEDRKIAVENKKSSAATAESNTAQKINVERKSSTGSVNMNRKSSVEKSSSSESALASEKKSSKDMSSIVPMNLRDSFFDDPFFQDNWMDIQQSQKNFFSKAQEQFKQQMQKMESSMNDRMSLSNFFDKDFSLAKFAKEEKKPKAKKPKAKKPKAKKPAKKAAKKSPKKAAKKPAAKKPPKKAAKPAAKKTPKKAAKPAAKKPAAKKAKATPKKAAKKPAAKKAAPKKK